MWCLIPVLLLLGYVTSQEVTEGKNHQYSSKVGHLREIPRRFEVSGGNSMDMFSKYVKDIQKLAHENNLTVLYKVRVDVSKPMKKRQLKKITFKSKKIKSKKYNIPLKKQSMKLSNFEIILKKLAEENVSRDKKIDVHQDILATDKQHQQLQQPIYTVKQAKVLKFKPIVSKVKTNFTKRVKPVKNRIITLSAGPM